MYLNKVPGEPPVWHLDPLIKIQNNSTRTITFSHYLDHTAPLLEILNILYFKKLVKQRIYLLISMASKFSPTSTSLFLNLNADLLILA